MDQFKINIDSLFTDEFINEVSIFETVEHFLGDFDKQEFMSLDNEAFNKHIADNTEFSDVTELRKEASLFVIKGIMEG